MDIMTAIEALTSWPLFVMALAVFGFVPKLVLRIIVLAFEKEDPRRSELLAEVHVVPRLERPFWVFEQLEVAICEGVWGRIKWAATGRIIHRWHLDSGVEMNRQYPDSFWIPSDDQKGLIAPGSTVKLMFYMKDGWCERMWVDVSSVKKGKFSGVLINDPIGIPRLASGKKVRFRAEHVIGVLENGDE